MLKVLYDGKCSICRKEITYYQKIASPGRFEWLDVTADTTILEANNLKLSTVLMELHTIDQDGRISKGVDSFIAIWQRLPYWHILARIAALPLVKDLLQWLYKIFARRRFKRLSHCQIALQKDQ